MVYARVIPRNKEQVASQTTGFEFARTVVVKLGSAVLTQPDSLALDMSAVEEICRQVAEQVKQGRQVVIVSSGAVAAGRNLLEVWDRRPTVSVKQALASVGQTRLMQIYADIFARHGIVVGQMLLSLSDMETRRRYVNARYTLEELLRRGCVPIINENDTVTVDELKFGDNDGLAAMVAVKMQADALLLLSDVPGLYDSNPKTNPEAQLIPIVERISPDIVRTTTINEAGNSKPGVSGSGKASAGGAKNANDKVSVNGSGKASGANSRGKAGAAKIQMGTGGMETKLQAARLATANGVATVIGPGKRADVITEALRGVNVGTWFPATECHRSRREKWILSGKSHGRRLVVDAGAREALRKKNKSLLPAGVRAVEGTFQAMDIVEIVDADGQPVARGIVNYSAAQLRRIAGKKSSQIEEVLGAKPYDEAVHRDNLVLV